MLVAEGATKNDVTAQHVKISFLHSWKAFVRPQVIYIIRIR